MKSQPFLLAVLMGGIAVAVQAQPTEPSPNNAPPVNIQENAPPPPQDQQSPPPVDNAPGADAANNSDATAVNSATNTSTTAKPQNGSAGAPVTLVPPKSNSGAKGDKSLRMNFRNAPLDQVLNYMSDAAGYIIILETELKGTVDVWSNQPLTKAEAVTLLNSVLSKNGYAVVQDGRFLTVVSKDEARRRDIPIKSGNNPTEIPKDTQIVTQIIPVRSLNPTQLLKDLAPLLPTDTTITANEAGNSLIMTDTQLNIHRMAEIIKALDSVSSSINSIRVFQLRYADSKTTVTVIKELFPSQDSTSSGRGNQGSVRGGNNFPMFPGGFNAGDNNNNNANSSASKASIRVLAVADENSNSVIVSAPDDILPIVGDLITNIDVSVDDIAEMKVFRLRYADPTEMANLLTSLFPDDTTSNNNNNNMNRFAGGPFGMMGGQQRQTTTTTSDRAKRKGRVLAVADARTASVVVNADKSLMPHISTIIQQLDSNPAKKQKVYVYSLENADVQDVEQVLNDLFQSSNSRSSRSSSSSQTSPLTTRSTTMQQQQSQSQSSFGSSSSSGRSGF